MPRRKDLKEKRDKRIVARYDAIVKQHPQWRHMAILEKLEDEFCLSTHTLTAILIKNR